MSSLHPIQSADLAVAWGRALDAVSARGVDEVTPLVVNISGFLDGFPSENATIRAHLDAALESAVTTKPSVCSIETTANLIFPENLWLRYRNAGRDAFFDSYLKLLPRLQKRDRRNHKGTYFSRFLSYGKSKSNQLKHVLDAWQDGHHRRSGLQVILFDPTVDHHRQPFLGFPCLDYVTFTPNTHEKTLSLTALYAEQYVFDRGYGNYLGLCRLGRFVAREMKLRFNQLTCIASCALRGEAIKKREAQALVEALGAAIATEAS